MPDQRPSSRPAPAGFLRGAWVWLLCALLCAAFFWDVLLAPSEQLVSGNDLAHMFRIWLDFAKGSIGSGVFPLWNPYLYAGMPLVSDPQPALFYPPTWLAFLMPTTRALGLMLVLHVWWSMVGAALWLRSESDGRGNRLSWSGAISGAAVFAFSGYVFARIQAGHLGVVTTGAWLPWGLWALRRLAEHVSRRRVAAGAVCVALASLAGHSATLIYVAFLWTAYGISLVLRRQPTARARLLLCYAGVGCLGAALAAVQLAPFLSYFASSTRSARSDYAFASRFSWPVGYLITLFVPGFFGEPVRTGYWGDSVYEEMIYYVGVLPLLLAWVAWRLPRRPGVPWLVGFWSAVGGTALLTAFGAYGILHRLLYRFVPGVSMMRAPARAGMLFTCSAAFLVAYALSAMVQLPTEQRLRLLHPLRETRAGWIVPLVAAVAAMGCYLVYAFARETNPEVGRFWHTASAILSFGLFFALASAYLTRWGMSSLPRWLPAAGAALIILDLWSFGAGLVQVVPAALSGYWRIVARHIEADEGRVLPWGLQYFEQNGCVPFGVRSVFGYNPLESQSYNAFIDARPDPRAPVYDLLNVGYVSATVPLSLEDRDTLSLVAEDDGVFIYERSTEVPRVWMASNVAPAVQTQMISLINDADFDPEMTAYVPVGVACLGGADGSVSLLGENANTQVAYARGDGGLVIFSERYAPGWTATVDGARVPVVAVYGLLRGVCVPSGEHTIVLRYRPPSLTLGAAITLLAGAVLLYLHTASVARQRLPPDAPV